MTTSPTIVNWCVSRTSRELLPLDYLAWMISSWKAALQKRKSFYCKIDILSKKTSNEQNTQCISKAWYGIPIIVIVFSIYFRLKTLLPVASHLDDKQRGWRLRLWFPTMDAMALAPYQRQSEYIERPIQARFSPYDFNGGFVIFCFYYKLKQVSYLCCRRVGIYRQSTSGTWNFEFSSAFCCVLLLWH